MTDPAQTHPGSTTISTTSADVVWDDEVWVLARHDAGDALGLTLCGRGTEALGQLDDEHASQLGRISNRLVRILEHLPGAGTVAIGRVPGPHVNATFVVDGVATDQLPEIATKLANWGGEARA